MDEALKQIFYNVRDKLSEGGKKEITFSDIDELSKTEPLLRGQAKEDIAMLLSVVGE